MQRLMAFIFVITMQHPHILRNNIYHSRKRRPPPFFIRIPILYLPTFWFILLTKSVFWSGIYLVVFLEYTFNFVLKLPWIVIVVWLTDERCLALFPAGTIVRDPHYRESPTRREQDLTCAEPEFRLCRMKLCSSAVVLFLKKKSPPLSLIFLGTYRTPFGRFLCTNPSRIPIPSTTRYRGSIPSSHSA